MLTVRAPGSEKFDHPGLISEDELCLGVENLRVKVADVKVVRMKRYTLVFLHCQGSQLFGQVFFFVIYATRVEVLNIDFIFELFIEIYKTVFFPSLLVLD